MTDSQPTIRVRSFERPDAGLLEQLAAARTPDLANILGRAAVADPVLRSAWRGARVLGPALTVKVPETDNLGAIYAAMNAQRGDVLVVEAGAQSTSAIAGALLGRAALKHGVQGLVIDGAIRDVLELEAMHLPVWSRHVCPRQSTKNQDASVGVTVTIAGCRVDAGDIVMADDDGIVFASAARIRESLDAIQRVLANEKKWEDISALEAALQGLLSKVKVERDG